MYEMLKTLISSSLHVEFGTSLNGPSDSWIEKAEQVLGITFPPSYKWWLRNYGGGFVSGVEIKSIYQIEFDKCAPGDIVISALSDREEGLYGKEKLIVCNSESDEIWYFDTTRSDFDGEFRIYFFDHCAGHEELYASSFAEFLEKIILDYK